MVDPAKPPDFDGPRQLLNLCRTGRLHDIEKWIADGKPFDLPPRTRKTLLQIAVETGFHSLIELIVKHDGQPSKNAALADAVAFHKLDLVQLLVENGAEVKSVPFADVLLEWNPLIVRFFLENGADPVEDSPFTVAFTQKIRTALGVFTECKRARPEISAALLDQASAALRYFCEKGDLKWISLMLWAGADARSLGPNPGKDYSNDPECFTTALKEACYVGHIEVLKKLKPDCERDDLTNLLHCAAVSGHVEMIRYLLSIGAKTNDKANGGSSALDTCFWHLNFRGFSPYHSNDLRSRYAVSKGLDCTRELTSHGAIWNPDDLSQLNSLRRALLGCQPDVTIELLKILQKNNACPAERLGLLLDKPKMQEHLASQTWHLRRIKLPEDKKRKREPRPPSEILLRKYNRTELYEKVWSEPTRTVAQHYGVSDVMLGKACRALRVPVPGRGYWAKKAAGKATRKRPPLPTLPGEVRSV